MDDVLLPLALAFATASLTLVAHGAMSAAARHRLLRARERGQGSSTASEL